MRQEGAASLTPALEVSFDAKTFLLATALFATMGTVAFAADLPVEPVPVLPPLSSSHGRDPTPRHSRRRCLGRERDPHSRCSTAMKGWSRAAAWSAYLAAIIGRTERDWVFGAEADIEWADIQNDGSDGGVDVSTTMNWDASFRGRAGYAWNRALLYATGGFAFAGLEGDVNPGPSADSSGMGLDGGRGR